MGSSLNWRPIISHEKVMDRCGLVSANIEIIDKLNEFIGLDFVIDH